MEQIYKLNLGIIKKYQHYQHCRHTMHIHEWSNILESLKNCIFLMWYCLYIYAYIYRLCYILYSLYTVLWRAQPAVLTPCSWLCTHRNSGSWEIINSSMCRAKNLAPIISLDPYQYSFWKKLFHRVANGETNQHQLAYGVVMERVAYMNANKTS